MWKKLVCIIIFCSICGYICRSYDCSSFLLLETWLMMIRKSLPKVSINITWSTGSLRHILGNIAWWPWCSIFSSPGFGPCELLPSLFVLRPSVNISHFNLLLRNYWANLNKTLLKWSLGGPLPKLCPVILTSNQDGHQAKNRKKGMKFKRNLLLWNYWANLNKTLLKWSLGGPLPKLCLPFQNSDLLPRWLPQPNLI